MFTAIIVTSCGSGDETNPGLCFWVDAMLHTVLPLTRPIDVTRATYLCLLMTRTCYGINICYFILQVWCVAWSRTRARAMLIAKLHVLRERTNYHAGIANYHAGIVKSFVRNHDFVCKRRNKS